MKPRSLYATHAGPAFALSPAQDVITCAGRGGGRHHPHLDSQPTTIPIHHYTQNTGRRAVPPGVGARRAQAPLSSFIHTQKASHERGNIGRRREWRGFWVFGALGPVKWSDAFWGAKPPLARAARRVVDGRGLLWDTAKERRRPEQIRAMSMAAASSWYRQ